MDDSEETSNIFRHDLIVAKFVLRCPAHRAGHPAWIMRHLIVFVGLGLELAFQGSATDGTVGGLLLVLLWPRDCVSR